MRDTHFLNPLLDVALLVGSLLLVFHRTAPLGIIVFAPMFLVFFGFHVFLNGTWLVGTVELASLLGLAWAYRRAFVPLWNYQ
ncbi:hypothetical protein B0E52_01225 [Rhodanobacter sp. C06]|nr:hypothetical protein B0E52_01225 [Rhodanobacter sp. C06]